MSAFEKPELNGVPSRWEVSERDRRNEIEVDGVQSRWEMSVEEQPKEALGNPIVELETGVDVAKEKA